MVSRSLPLHAHHAAHLIQQPLVPPAGINRGVATALRDLGAMYLDGRGVPKDEKHAVELYTEAARKGDPGSKHNLGEMYYFGRYFPQNHAAGCKWFTDAANDGFMNSIVWVVALCDAASTNVPAVSVDHPWRKQIADCQMEDVTGQLTAALKSGDAKEMEKARFVLSGRSYRFGILK